MKKNANQFILLIITIGVLSSCSVFTSQPHNAQISQHALGKKNELREQYASDPNYTYGIGFGQTPQEAILNARSDFSSQILVSIQKTTSQSIEVSDSSINTTQHRKQKSQLATFTDLELQDVKTIKESRLNSEDTENYFAVVQADQETVSQIRQKALKSAPLMLLINRLNQAKTLESKIQLLEKSFSLLVQKNLQQASFLYQGEKYTFQNYLTLKANELTKQTKALVTKENSIYAIYLVEANHFTPLKNISLKVAQQTGFTDNNGRFAIAELPKTTTIAFNFLEHTTQIRSFIKGGIKSELIIHTSPAGFLAEITGNTNKSITTPEVIYLSEKEATHYQLKVHDKDDYAGFKDRLKVTPGFDIFIDKPFEKITYGTLNLDIDSDSNLNIKAPNGQLVWDQSNPYRQDKALVGTYHITIEDQDKAQDRQTITDTISLQQNQHITRIYHANQDRGFFREGSSFSLKWFMGGGPSELASIESKENDQEYPISNNRVLQDLTTSGFGFDYKKFWTNLYAGGMIGLGTTSNSHTSFNGWRFDGEIGLYTALDTGYLSVGAGYTSYSADNEDSDDRYYRDPILEFDASTPTVNLRWDINRVFYIDYKHALDELATSTLSIGIGSTTTESGYRRPASIRAQQDIHYTGD